MSYSDIAPALADRRASIVDTLSKSYAVSPFQFRESAIQIADELRTTIPENEFDIFLGEILYSLAAPVDEIYAATEVILLDDDERRKLNAKVTYLNSGGDRVDVIESVFYYLSSQSADQAVLDLFRYAEKRSKAANLSVLTHFNVAISVFNLGEYDLAFRQYINCLTMNPNQWLSEKIHRNISAMATQKNHRQSIEYVDRRRQEMLFHFHKNEHLGEREDDIIFTLKENSTAEITQSLLKNGFCVIRDACDLSAIEAAKIYIDTEFHSEFPASFDPRLFELISQLYLFDPTTVLARVFDGPAAVNMAACVARKVSPDNTQSQTPFHQDVSAFLAPVINIWTPLTGSGDDFPSIEFVRKRIDQVEETIITAGQYNQVEIDEASVLQRYGGLLYEYKSPTPGDCVIFLGSTIHRTSNMQAATKDRLSLEVRYSPATL